jgi:selenide,water dikinase
LCGLKLTRDPNILVGMESGDDAGVYRLTDDLAIVQTVDFITPIVDDPYTFGQVAAANALSDVYAMGGRPLTAMNIACFPVGKQDISVLGEVLRGGLDKVREAGASLVGGHSISDDELKFGLSVTGTVHPSRILARTGARHGDRLILTKSIGTGIVTTALKGGMVDQGSLDAVTRSMTTLNKTASEAMIEAGAHACTDVTGFGLLGHACGMITNNDIGVEIEAAAVSLFPDTRDLAQTGMVPGGTGRNMEFYRNSIKNMGDIDDVTLDIMFDPQTSGGLLIAVPGNRAYALLENLQKCGVADAAIIGAVVEEHPGKIVILE